MPDDLDTSQISSWQSIVTLVVFVLTNINVLFPFTIRVYVPRVVSDAVLRAVVSLRIIPPRDPAAHRELRNGHAEARDGSSGGRFVRLDIPMNFISAPIIADVFLLAIQAIGRREVHDGTIGANNIQPIDIMAFFLTMAYIAISIDASGLLRYLAFRVLQWGGKVGHRLFFYLYLFFFILGSFVGNDPIILSGTAFLAYMTRVSTNIVHPTAWIHTQFAIANIASAIIVSSNPTNLVLARAFNVKFIHYTANMIVPVIVTAIVLFPFLLYVVFASESLIPSSITMHSLSDADRAKKPVNPNIPFARGVPDEFEDDHINEQGEHLSLEEIMNPFLDKGGAAVGAIIMAATLITVLALNATSSETGGHPVYWVTLPTAFGMFSWDLAMGWLHREETREIARKGRREMERARARRAIEKEDELKRRALARRTRDSTTSRPSPPTQQSSWDNHLQDANGGLYGMDKMCPESVSAVTSPSSLGCISSSTPAFLESDDGGDIALVSRPPLVRSASTLVPDADHAHGDPEASPEASSEPSPMDEKPAIPSAGTLYPAEGVLGHPTLNFEEDLAERINLEVARRRRKRPRSTLVSLATDAYMWLQETFPTVTAVVVHLPATLVPFAFAMFVLVQALVTKGWVSVFAYGWDHWVNKTGVVGSIGGMGFLSVVLCNFAGTNFGTTILLSRVIQAWEEIHARSGVSISDRLFWATVYSMALGVNYGAFSTAFSASLAGLLWRDILARKHIHVRSLDFARVNLPIITVAMIVGCVVLLGQVYIVRGTKPYEL